MTPSRFKRFGPTSVTLGICSLSLALPWIYRNGGRGLAPTPASFSLSPARLAGDVFVVHDRLGLLDRVVDAAGEHDDVDALADVLVELHRHLTLDAEDQV